MKRFFSLLLAGSMVLSLTACKSGQDEPVTGPTAATDAVNEQQESVRIVLSDDEITVNGEKASESAGDVYVANDVIYYEKKAEIKYGAGLPQDMHEDSDAKKHTVIHITEPGDYILTGTLSAGQIAVDLGEAAVNTEGASVNLFLDNVNITNDVAPAIIFYNVYECADVENPHNGIRTNNAGANIHIVDNSVNTINGSYVAPIYDAESVIMNADGVVVESADVLHDYDGAIHSKMTMNIYGGENNSGVLNVNADNEGISSEMHLTIEGGNLNIISNEDGLNANNEGVSVITINGGNMSIRVDGPTGDGIDSNGWIDINDGNMIIQSSERSAESGLDSGYGTRINGGSMIATGNSLNKITDSTQTYAVFEFLEPQTKSPFSLKTADGKNVFEISAEKCFHYLVVAGDELVDGDYTLWRGANQMEGYSVRHIERYFVPSPGYTPPEETAETDETSEDIQEPVEEPVSDETGPIEAEETENKEPPKPAYGAPKEKSSVFTIQAGGNFFRI